MFKTFDCDKQDLTFLDFDNRLHSFMIYRLEHIPINFIRVSILYLQIHLYAYISVYVMHTLCCLQLFW